LQNRAISKVVGIVRRSELIPEIEKLGVDFVGVESPDLPKQIQIATGGTPISLGLDAVGGPATATMASVLSSGAHLVSYAWLSGLPIHVAQGDLIGKRLNIHGFWMYYEEYLPKMRAALTEAAKVVASGKLTLPVTTTYKLSQIKEAIEHSQRGGKVLLDSTTQTNAMSYSISTLLIRNLRDVFGENDPARWRAAIDEIYTEDCVFYDPSKEFTVAVTRSIASQARSRLLTLTFYISQLPTRGMGNAGRVQWVAGRPGEAPAYAGTDFIIARDGRIAAVYLFFDKLP